MKKKTWFNCHDVLYLQSVVRTLVKELVNIVKPSFPCKVDHNACWGLPTLGHTEATITYLPAWWTHPAGIQKRLAQIFTVSIQQARATELSPNTPAVLVVTDGLGVQGLLATLMTSGTPHSIIYFVRAPFNGDNAPAIVSY